VNRADVLKLRQEAASGTPLRELAERFGCSLSTAARVSSGESYPELPGPLRRGGHRRGEGHPRRKLSEDDVREIRRAHRAGEALLPIAHALGVTPGAVYHAVHGRSWAWLK